MTTNVALYCKIMLLAALALVLSSCGDGSTPQKASNAFASKSYSTMDKAEVIRIISEKEIERSDSRGNLVGSYTREGNKIRAVFEVGGTKSALYFSEKDDILTAEADGKIYLTDAAFKKIESTVEADLAKKKADARPRQTSTPDTVQTQGRIMLISSALNRYEVDFDDYPASDGVDGLKGACKLYERLMTKEKGGPYVNHGDIPTCVTSQGTAFADAWNKPIHYIHRRDYQNLPPNKRSYRLISGGPNGIIESGGRDTDDIVNWNKENPQ